VTPGTASRDTGGIEVGERRGGGVPAMASGWTASYGRDGELFGVTAAGVNGRERPRS